MYKFIKNAMKSGQNYNLWEISFFKIYIISVSILISIWFPVILSLNIYFYLTLFIILDIFSIIFLIKKEGNFLKKIFNGKKGYKVFKHYGIFGFGLFKITLFSFGLLIAKIFPVILEINIGYYLIIFGFGVGYFLSSFSKK